MFVLCLRLPGRVVKHTWLAGRSSRTSNVLMVVFLRNSGGAPLEKSKPCLIQGVYPLVMTDIAMENGQL